jgi:hypothetical protein
MNKFIAGIAAGAAVAALTVAGFAGVGVRTASTATVAGVAPVTAVAEAVRTNGVETAAHQAATAGTATQPRLAGTPASCADGAYTLSGYKVVGGISFGYNPAGVPAGIAKTAGTAVRNSLLSVAAGANRCRYTARLNTSATYTGASTRRPQVNTAGACTGNDRVNVMGWGTLPTGYLAITCIYFAGGKVINADTMINRRYTWSTATPPHCNNTWDLQSVLTHEVGHTFGLSHVDYTAHGSAVMATLINPCDTTKRLLGRGDYAALVRLYGTR